MPKYQLSIGAIILSILVPLAITRAAYNDVTLTTDAIISVGGNSLTVSGSSANVQTLEVDSGDFSITIATGSSMTVTNTNRKTYTVEGVTSAYYTTSCSDTVSTLTITVPSATEAVPTARVTPTSTTCNTGTVGSTVSGSTGGGGGAPPAPVTTPIVIPAVIVAPVLGCPAGMICTINASVSSASINFTKDLSRGTEGNEVTALQKFLAKDPAIYPEGIANGFFGPATERAVKRFQAKYGISQLGRVGPATRAKLKEVSTPVGTIPAVAPAVVPGCPAGVVCTPAVSVMAVFTKLLSKGISSIDVKNLQKILNKDIETQISTSGDGSPGNETDYFGAKTLQAVQKFQIKYNIATPGSAGYGTVGPATRAKLNELAK
ncbi:MAG TPA: peptidoglycan-binding protein [Candidatus Paceibacterota bacterium]